MTRIPLKTLAGVALAALLLAGCQGVPLKLADRLVSDRAQIDPYQGRRVTGEAKGFQLMLFIPIAVNGRQQTAYENLLREAGDSVLSDVTITESWQWAFVGTLYTTTITAMAYPRKPAGQPVPKDGAR